MSASTHQPVKHIVSRTQVIGYTFAVFIVERHVGKSSYVQAVIVFRKKKLIAYRNQRSSLSTESDIQSTEIAYHFYARCGVDMGSGTYLEIISQVRTMEYGMSVRCDEIHIRYTLFGNEFLYFLP